MPIGTAHVEVVFGRPQLERLTCERQKMANETIIHTDFRCAQFCAWQMEPVARNKAKRSTG